MFKLFRWAIGIFCLIGRYPVLVLFRSSGIKLFCFEQMADRNDGQNSRVGFSWALPPSYNSLRPVSDGFSSLPFVTHILPVLSIPRIPPQSQPSHHDSPKRKPTFQKAYLDDDDKMKLMLVQQVQAGDPPAIL